MATAIPIDVYQFLEGKLGKEEALKVASAIEIGFEVIEKRAEAIALQKKLEIKDELTKELVTKAEFFGETRAIRQEMQTIEAKIEGKIEAIKIELNQKFNFMIILMIIALTLMNPVMAEIIKGILKL